jgi:hypothetical protein
MKKEILEKLYGSKVELSEVKVELALIDEFNDLKSKAVILTKEIIDKDFPNLQKNANDLKAKIRTSINTVTDLMNKKSGLDVKFQELGLDFKKDASFKGYDAIIKENKIIFDMLKQLSSF